MSIKNKVIIRPFQSKDFEAVASIMFDAFKSKFKHIAKLSEAELYELLIVSGIMADSAYDGYYVAEVDNQVMGCINFTWIGQKKSDSKHKKSFFELMHQFGLIKLLRFYGILALLQSSLNLGECYIDNVAVHKDARGLGVGSQLIEVSTLMIKEHDALNYCSLHVVGSNAEAHKLYKRLGFQTRDHIKSNLLRQLIGEDIVHYMIKD